MVPLAATERRRYTPTVYVDCANGVGGLWVEKYLPVLTASTTAVICTPDNQPMPTQSLTWPGGKRGAGWMEGEYTGQGINARVMNDADNVPALLNSKVLYSLSKQVFLTTCK